MVLSSLLTDQQLCVLLPFCSTRKEDLKGLHFQRQPLLFSVFSRSPEWESNDIMIPLIHVHAVSRFFFSSVQESLFLGQYLTIPLITQLLHNLTLSNPTYFLLQSIVSPVSSFQFPSKLFFFFSRFCKFLPSAEFGFTQRLCCTLSPVMLPSSAFCPTSPLAVSK